MNITLRHWRVWFMLGCLMTAAVVFFSLIPARDLPKLGVSDKWEHGTAYFVLAAWFGGLIKPRNYWLLALALFVVGALVELAQGAMHVGRERDALDLAANSAGIVVGLLVSLVGIRRWPDWMEKWLPKN